jgi:hypothetical protein
VPKKTPTPTDLTDAPAVENHGERPAIKLSPIGYLMTPTERGLYGALKAALPMMMQTVIAIRETHSHHWELLYADDHWSLLVAANAVALSVGRGGLTHLGDDDQVSEIISICVGN